MSSHDGALDSPFDSSARILRLSKQEPPEDQQRSGEEPNLDEDGKPGKKETLSSKQVIFFIVQPFKDLHPAPSPGRTPLGPGRLREMRPGVLAPVSALVFAPPALTKKT